MKEQKCNLASRRNGAKTDESGSILLELIAVLALLALISPIVYQQSVRRAIELSNINIAGEMRTIKTATQAYIKATCPNSAEACISVPTKAGIADYMPDGSNIPNEYDIEFYEKEIGAAPCTTYKTGESGATCHLITSSSFISGKSYQRYALIFDECPLDECRPDNWNLKRAKRIASLIGTDGGICKSTGLSGVNGAWSIASSRNTCAEPLVVVHTGLNIW